MVELSFLCEAWSMLMRNKVVQARTVYNQIKPEHIAKDRLEDPEVASEIEKTGFYEVSSDQQTEIIKALDYLVELGYVEKRIDTIYNTYWVFIAHPYIPHLSISGAIGIISDSGSSSHSFSLNSKQYKIFKDTAKKFKDQVDLGKHPHITHFSYGVDYSYKTYIYEIKTRYFDAIYPRYNKNKDKMRIDVVEPIIERRNEKKYKNWEIIDTIEGDILLNNPKEIDHLIEEIEWKKKYDGVLIFQDEVYTLIPKKQKKIIENENIESPWTMPNFLDGGIISYENFLSRIFEDATAEFLRDKHGYGTRARIKPNYLEGKEIDVFAVKNTEPRHITVCECKLRFNNAPITISEITCLNKKIKIIEEKEGERGQTIFHKWMVSNSTNFEQGVVEYAKNIGIELVITDIGKNWKKRSDWKINKIKKQK